MQPVNEARIIDSWQRNVAPWVAAVRQQRIESRALVTNQAIVDAVASRCPRSVLDIGCGEGWLVRELMTRGFQVTGVDAVPLLIEQARAEGGDFQVASYEAIAGGALKLVADMLVCNFSLLGEHSVDQLIRAVPSLLHAGGTLVVQTLHPLMACGGQSYRDGWREGSWDGIEGSFSDPAPWYFRTLESWIRLFRSSGLQLCELREPLHPVSGKPVSAIFIAQPAR
ncbi:MAG: methyltransferase domain-containing protein [Xanthomonadaceae bacterium]|nr:methyltransferase domain-containing protein [Xanthomonadaceae bacterium]